MIGLYKDYIENLLTQSGVSCKVIKSLKELKQYNSNELAAILYGDEEFQKDGKKNYVMINGKKVLRIRKFIRLTRFVVVIAHRTDDLIDEIMCSFMANLDSGIDDGNGNWVEITCTKGDWVDEEDSILRSKLAVQLLIEFTGGIYVDKEKIMIDSSKIQIDV